MPKFRMRFETSEKSSKTSFLWFLFESKKLIENQIKNGRVFGFTTHDYGRVAFPKEETLFKCNLFCSIELFLQIRYSRYSITFPAVSGGDTTVFNQGYFFRNVKVEGHDESDLPVLIQAYEKKSLFKR